MKKIICLILALATMFIFVSCGECETHVDENKDRICDECGAAVELPGDAIFAMAKDADPTMISTIVAVTRGDVSYTSNYITSVYSAEDFVHEYTTQRPAGLDDDTDKAYVETTAKVTYKSGVYTYSELVDGAYTEPVVMNEAPVVEYLYVTNKINSTNVTNFTIDKSGKIMKATLTKEQCEAIFGITVNTDGDIALTITTNGVRLANVSLIYTRTDGTIITSETSYSYAPLSTDSVD